MEENKREVYREKCDIPITFDYFRDKGPFKKGNKGTLIDFGIKGVRLNTEEPLLSGDIVVGDIDLKDGEEPLYMISRVVYVEEGESYGLQFITQNEERVSTFVMNLQIQKIKKLRKKLGREGRME